jgi:hypothetical protein
VIDTLQIYDELSPSLGEGAAHKLADVLGAVLTEVREGAQRDVAELRAVVGDLAEAQKRTEQRLEQLTIRVDELAEAQKRTEQRLEQLTIRVDELTEAQKQLVVRVDKLAEAQNRTEERLEQLIAIVNVHTVKLARLEGRSFETDVRDKAPAYFGRLLKRTRAIMVNDLEEQLETVLSPEELADIYRLDVVVRGKPRDLPDAPEIIVAIEVSVTIDFSDVDRAWRRASNLRKAGLKTVAAVAGEAIDAELMDHAARQGVAVFCDGQHHHWQAALNQSA